MISIFSKASTLTPEEEYDLIITQLQELKKSGKFYFKTRKIISENVQQRLRDEDYIVRKSYRTKRSLLLGRIVKRYYIVGIKTPLLQH
ncbi:hypothetical protein [Myroides indicus]|uniref:Uncharacterized protein n=1 Tax=Myroides indicus TaxID=1323422 RepID=A0A4R7F3R4_9FLAO|nr:hypothetical protein [Myroides indicus]TDS65070.1 hypothetical protein C8P70_10390 [Myroides indicus]